jgi:hypothetical protein
VLEPAHGDILADDSEFMSQVPVDQTPVPLPMLSWLGNLLPEKKNASHPDNPDKRHIRFIDSPDSATQYTARERDCQQMWRPLGVVDCDRQSSIQPMSEPEVDSYLRVSQQKADWQPQVSFVICTLNKTRSGGILS